MRNDIPAGFHLVALLSKTPVGKAETAYKTADQAAALFKAAKSIAALSLADCNYGLTKRQETRRENLIKIVQTIAGHYALEASCYGDPRGYVVRLKGPNIETNSWGDGFGVA